MSDPSLEIAGLEHISVDANHLRFHVAALGSGDRLALCLHGFPELWLSWRHQMPLLAKMGWRVWAPDLRGYGESEKPQAVSAYALETLMADVGGLIDASEAREVMLIGHDWGGLIAWYFAIRRIRPLERLVILNIPHPGAGARAFLRPRQWLRSWYALAFQLKGFPERVLAADDAKRIGLTFSRTACHPERFSDEVLQAYRKAASAPGALTGMIHYYRALIRGGGLARQRALGYPVIEAPTLFLWGEQDIALTRETTHGTEAWVSDLTLRYLPTASHWVQQDEPEIVNEMLEAWLSRRPVPESADVLKGRS